MNETEIAKKIRTALDAERWGDYDVDAFPVKDGDDSLTLFVENDQTDESYEYLITIERQG